MNSEATFINKYWCAICNKEIRKQDINDTFIIAYSSFSDEYAHQECVKNQ